MINTLLQSLKSKPITKVIIYILRTGNILQSLQFSAHLEGNIVKSKNNQK